jgi:two-component system, NarL family, sensor kinase
MFTSKEEGFYAVVLVSIFVLMLIGVIITTAILYYYRKRKHLIEKSQIQNTILNAKLEIQEQTFKNISQEIHDNIGQILSLAKLNLATLEDAPDQADGPEKISSTKKLVSKAIQDLRDLSHGLNADYVGNMGLCRAIEYELEMIGKSGMFRTLFSLDGDVRRIDVQRELITFRIVQELLTNIIKHAEADHISVKIEFEEVSFQLAVSDNGKGINVERTRSGKQTGMGLLNIYERAKMIDSDVQFSSVAGEGTTVRIIIPYQSSKSIKND